jgi:hypothetical protein
MASEKLITLTFYWSIGHYLALKPALPNTFFDVSECSNNSISSNSGLSSAR